MRIFSHLYDVDQMLTPIAVNRWVRSIRPFGKSNLVYYKTLHIFGLRVAYWEGQK